jgi:hypothetical protein
MVQRVLLTGWLLLAAWGSAHAPKPPAAPAATPTRRMAPTAVAGYGDLAAWSVRGADGRYRLVIRRAGGKPRFLPVPSSPTAFGVDLGPGPGGGTWAVYSRCMRCGLQAADLATGRERPVGGGARGRLPALWGSELAYFAPTVDHRSALHLTSVTGGADHVVPLRPVDVHETPLALDLRGGRLAYVLFTYDDDGYHGDQALIAAGVDGSGQRTVDRGGSGEECTKNLASPALTAIGLVWLHAELGDPGDCRPRPQLRRLDFASGAQALAPMPAAPVAATLVGGRALVLAPPAGARVDTAGREPCRLDRGPGNRCDLTDVGAPAWSPAPH